MRGNFLWGRVPIRCSTWQTSWTGYVYNHIKITTQGIIPPHNKKNNFAAGMVMEGRSKNRLIRLLGRLHRIQYPTTARDLEVAMHEFTHELLQRGNLEANNDGEMPNSGQIPLGQVSIFVRGDETILTDLESHGALTIILRTMKRCLCYVDGNRRARPGFAISPQFFNSACIALVHFCFQSRHRSRIANQNGGFDVIVDVMQTYRTVDFVQIIGIAALMILGTTKAEDVYTTCNVETIILQEIVFAIETHQDNAKLYTVACSALGSVLGPGSNVTVIDHQAPRSDFESDWYHRTLSAICYGIIVHMDDQMAVGAGNGLLSNIVGPDVAAEMVAEFEQAHGVVCCAAAA